MKKVFLILICLLTCHSLSYNINTNEAAAYSAYISVTASNAVRSINPVVQQFDLTGVSYSHPNITMISPSFGVSSAHFTPGVGATVKFYNRDGIAVERVIAQQWTLSGNGYSSLDGRLSRMSVPLASGDKVAWYPIQYLEPNAWIFGFGGSLFANSPNTFPSSQYEFHSLRALMVASGQAVLIQNETNILATLGYKGGGYTTFPRFSLHGGWQATGGESSSPLFAVLPDNRLVLLGTYWYPGSGTSHAGFHTNLVSIMAQYGESPTFMSYSCIVASISNHPSVAFIYRRYSYVSNPSTNQFVHIKNYTNITTAKLKNIDKNIIYPEGPAETVWVTNSYYSDRRVDMVAENLNVTDNSTLLVNTLTATTVTNNGTIIVRGGASIGSLFGTGTVSTASGSLVYSNGTWRLNATAP